MKNSLERPLEIENQSPFWYGLSFVCICLFSLLLSVVLIYLFSLHKGETVTVPQLVNKPLVEALLELQDKKLRPEIQLKVSDQNDEMGTVLYQNPASGARVLIDRSVYLMVSEGAGVDRVGNYLGQKLSDVQTQIERQQLISKNISIKAIHGTTEGNVPVDTVLSQNPDPGTLITNHTQLELWVEVR